MDKVLDHHGKEVRLHILAPPGELLKEELEERKINESITAGLKKIKSF